MLRLTLIGNISQWGEVKKKSKERTQSKPKEQVVAANEASSQSARGGRGRGGLETGRGGRGRGSDRGRGAGRGGRGGLVNGSRDSASKKEETSTDISGLDNPSAPDGAASGWDSAVVDSIPLESSWENITVGEASTPAAEESKPKPSSKLDGTRSWASMFSKPAPVPAPPKAQASQTVPSHDAPVEPPVTATSLPVDEELPGLPPPLPATETLEAPNTPPTSDLVSSEQATNITPSKDDLTETNLEQVPDVSNPAPSATAASTVASTADPQNAAHISQQTSRPSLGGYATSAYKATGMPGLPRSASYQRKILEQEEAVVMPGKHAVDRAAVQFGSMGLNGSTDDADVDSDREDAETRAQPPQHSPIAPRAALPPAPQHAESLPASRQAPGLPPVSQPSSIQSAGQGLPGDHTAPQQPSQPNLTYSRYGPQSTPQELSAPAQKPYEPFGQQAQQSHPYEGYPSATQAPGQSQQQAQSQPGAFSSAPNDQSSYYTSDNQRNAYQSNYYGNHGQQPGVNTHDTGSSQQRGNSAFATSAAEQNQQYPSSQAQPQPHQNRYGQPSEAQTSGQSTPNPAHPSQQQPNQPHQYQHGHGQAGSQHGGYPYGHSYYNPYYSAYMNSVSGHSYGRDRPMFDDVRRYEEQFLTQNPQYAYGGGQGAYGGGPFGGTGGKQGMYGQPHQGYGMSPQTSYDQHSASPANAGGLSHQHSSAPGRDSAAPGGLGTYGRTGSAQPSENPQHFSNTGSSNHSGIPDVFGRSQSGYPGHTSGLGGHIGQQGGAEDQLRGYGDASKVPGGPSPALGQPSARPGSAATPQAQSGLPPPQGQSQSQQGYGGGFMSHMHGQGGSHYGSGPGGLSGHHQYGGQNHQGGGYGAYGGGFGSSSYGSSNRGGWGANYGH